LIACFLSNISAKYYENLTMLSRVIAKNIRDVFFRHSVYECMIDIDMRTYPAGNHRNYSTCKV